MIIDGELLLEVASLLAINKLQLFQVGQESAEMKVGKECSKATVITHDSELLFARIKARS